MAGQSLGMFSCDELRRIAREEYGFGDVLAGIWCPYSTPNAGWIRNCPVGNYCINPESIQPCPEGKFCPHKTRIPEIDCPSCEEGEIELRRD